MIIHVLFVQNMRVTSILLRLGEKLDVCAAIHIMHTDRGDTTPRHLRMYVNHQFQ
ncbi:hypothetical protein BDR03DRAFT_969835 [Suillus americanus]|nr:hypothetical protein BDR03DRAFT_969835 [Suillus americanus]